MAAAAAAAAAAMAAAVPPANQMDELCRMLGHAGINNTGANVQQRVTQLFSGHHGLENVGDLSHLPPGSGKEMIKSFNANLPRNAPMNRRLGTIVAKKLDGLLFMAMDFHRRQQLFDPTEIDANPAILYDYETTFQAIKKHVDADLIPLPQWSSSTTWRNWKEKTMVAMASNYGEQYGSLAYIMNDPKPPGWDPNVEAKSEHEKLAYQLLRHGPAFNADNDAVWGLLHAAFVQTPAHAWIKPFETTRDGEGAYLSLLSHFESPGETAAQCDRALNVLNNTKYYGENVQRYETCIAKRANAIEDLSRLGQEFLDPVLTTKLHDSILVPTNLEVQTMKALMMERYRNDYQGAVDYSSTRILEINPRGSKGRGDSTPRRIASSNRSATIGGTMIADITHVPPEQWHALSAHQQDEVKRRRRELGKRSRSRSQGRGGRGRGRFGGRGGSARGRGQGRGRGYGGRYNDRSRGGRGAERQISAEQRSSQQYQAETPTSGGQQRRTNNQQAGQPSGRGPQNGARFGQSGALRPAEGA